jgi:hypothetical protein
MLEFFLNGPQVIGKSKAVFNIEYLYVALLRNSRLCNPNDKGARNLLTGVQTTIAIHFVLDLQTIHGVFGLEHLEL